MLSSNIDSVTKKRTRTNVKQSKYGCFTCKDRKIKCDELKPICRRCLTAKRPCGYPRGAPHAPESQIGTTCSTSPSSSNTSVPEPVDALVPHSSLVPNPSHPQNRFVSLTCNILAKGPRRAKNDLEVTFWSRAVPQLAQSVPSVHIAAAALGASYEAHVLRGTRTSKAVEYYSRALRLVQHDLSTRQNGLVPSLIACLFLSLVEVLEQELNKALLHLRGIYALMASGVGEDSKAIIGAEGVALLFQKLDLHLTTYSVSLPPELPSTFAPTAVTKLSESPDQVVFRMLHSCYHFTSVAFRYKYMSPRLRPSEFLIEQGRQLASLKQWLSTHPSPVTVAKNELAFVLHAQCLAALIHVANILEPRETAYDFYSAEFHDIIRLLETLLDHEASGCSSLSSFSDKLPAFTAEPGIIHPLYFTALKCRHPKLRRRAIAMLQKSGREGPWCGEFEAALASTVMEMEEQSAMLSFNGHDGDSNSELQRIGETSRINASWIIEFPDGMANNMEQADCLTKNGARSMMVLLVRCRDIEKMLHNGSNSPSQYPWMDRIHWDGWERVIQVPLETT